MYNGNKEYGGCYKVNVLFNPVVSWSIELLRGGISVTVDCELPSNKNVIDFTVFDSLNSNVDYGIQFSEPLVWCFPGITQSVHYLATCPCHPNF